MTLSIQSFLSTTGMGEGVKKKRAAEARAARKAKKAAEQAPTDPASSDDNLPTRSKKTGAAAPSRVLASTSTSKQAAKCQSVEGSASTDHTGTRRSTRSLLASASSSKSAKGHRDTGNNESIVATRPERVATAAAKALLERLQFSETEDTDLEEDPDGGSNGDLETDTIIELEDDDGVISGNGNGNESGIKVARAPTKVARTRNVPNPDEEESSGEDSEEAGESD